MGVKFDELHRGGWDPEARIADQDRDGVAAEIIYPTVGMSLCNHRDFDYKKACFDAYNRWIAEYCSAYPRPADRRGPDRDARRRRKASPTCKAIAALGLRGVMMPGVPAVEDYDSPVYDAVLGGRDRARPAAGVPHPHHARRSTPAVRRSTGSCRSSAAARTSWACSCSAACSSAIPDLRVVCVEADAGWVPHFMYRMDHAYKRHRYWLPPGQELSKLPSEYFAENIYVTFQDDWTAFRFAGDMNWRRLMWANDFPHSDSTWPWSQEMLAEHTADLSRRAAPGDPVRQRRRAVQIDVIDAGGLIMSEFDLVIRGGTVVDGTGAAARTADVAVRDGVVVEVGRGRRRRGTRGRRRRRARHARLRRHPHALRRPGHVGHAAGAVVVARRHHRRDGQLRRRLRAGAPGRPPAADRADGRRRGHPRRRAARGPVVGVADVRRVPRRRRRAARTTSTSARSSRTARCGCTSWASAAPAASRRRPRTSPTMGAIAPRRRSRPARSGSRRRAR